jgi:hypothetical protein
MRLLLNSISLQKYNKSPYQLLKNLKITFKSVKRVTQFTVKASVSNYSIFAFMLNNVAFNA